jgi:HlyD family secretion protein
MGQSSRSRMVPVMSFAVSIVIALLVLGLGGWATLASIEGAILAEGRIEASRTRLVVQHPEGGRVAELAVADGQPVAAGDLLARLDPGLLAAEREIVETQYVEALARAARLTAERDGAEALPLSPALHSTLSAAGPAAAQAAAQVQGQRQLLAARRETMARQIDQLTRRRAQVVAQRDGLDGQIAALASESALIGRDRDQQAELVARGLAPDARLGLLSREAVRMAGNHAAALAERAALDGRMTEIDLQILALEAGRREEAETGLRDLGVTLVELAMRRQVMDDRLSRLELRAPAAGRIHALAVGGPGAVLRPAQAGGAQSTASTFGAPVASITSRSKPSAQPAAGGIRARAARKSSSSG